MTGALTDTQIRNVLSSQVLGRLACADGQQPYIVPVTYSYDGDFIYGQTNEGRKLKVLRKNPLVCFEADLMMDMANWQSVLVFGTFEELSGKEAQTAKEKLFSRVFSLMTSSTLHGHEHAVSSTPDDSGREKMIMYRIRINELSGRYETR